MSNTRSLRNRSSRYSSPATFTDNQSSSNPTQSSETQDRRNGHQTNLDRWIEPSIRNAVPSFEDTRGLERVGVLEHMAPLGIPPSQKLLQKLKVNLSRSTPRVTSVHAEGVVTPDLEPTSVDVVSPIDSELLSEPPISEDVATISSPPRGRPSKQEVQDMRSAIDLTTPSPVKSTFTQNYVSPKPQSIQEHLREDRMKGVFDRAIAEANRQADLKLVPGLQQLFDDAKVNGSMWGLLDNVLNKSPTDAEFKVFKRYIKRGIRHHRKTSGTTVSSSFQSPMSNGFTPTQPGSYIHRLSSTGPLIAATSGDLFSTGSPFRFKPNNHKHRRTVSSLAQESSRSPSSVQVIMATDSLPGADETIQQHSVHRRKRTRSMSSSSDLSSALSLPESPRSDKTPETQADAGRPVKSSDARQGEETVAPGSRTRLSTLNQTDSSHPYSNIPTTIKFVNKKLVKTKVKAEAQAEAEEIETKRREFIDDSFHDYNTIPRPESSVRSIVHGHPITNETSLGRVPPPVLHPNQLLPSSATLLSPVDHQAPPEIQTNGTYRKDIDYDSELEILAFDVDLPASPVRPWAPTPPPAATADTTNTTNSRAIRPPTQQKARKSARVMISPAKPKDKNGVPRAAGIAREGQGKEMIGDDAESGSEENDEYCASCGGEGTLLCCDGCTNSFHHACLEPPLNPEDEVEGEWFCPRCIARQNKEPLPTTGLLSHVIRRVDDTIPKAYSLPFEVRDYFEGVKTGEEGEYEEVGLARNQNNVAKMNRAGFFDPPDYKQLRDSKGNFITCYLCGKTSNGRDIIPCDYCSAKWHTDCVDPPLAVPPRRAGGDKPNGYWRCPLHVDQDLAAFGRQAEAAPGDLGRLPRLRKPKKANIIDVCVTRGFRNNGVIEIDLMKDEMPDIKEVMHDHGIYRIPEKGIRLDFIDRVKKSWYEDHFLPQQMNAEVRIRNRLYRPSQNILHHPAATVVVRTKEPDFHKGAAAVAIAETAKANVKLRQKSLKEQHAIMSMLDMSQKDQGDSGDMLTDLINQLVADAPESVVSASNMSERERLLRIQKLVNERLAVVSDSSDTLGPNIKSTKKRHDRDQSYSDRSDIQVNGDGHREGHDDHQISDDGGDMDIT